MDDPSVTSEGQICSRKQAERVAEEKCGHTGSRGAKHWPQVSLWLRPLINRAAPLEGGVAGNRAEAARAHLRPSVTAEGPLARDNQFICP